RDILCANATLVLLNVSPTIAEQAAEIQSNYGLLLPDALQIATALTAGSSHFITNDTTLRRVESLTVILLSDLVN
ncbi:MAG: PIN domain-containing protein, partial [bacterium]